MFSKAHDLTLDYKYPEGSMLERVAARRAMKIAKSDALVKAPQDVSFSIEAAESVIRGKDVEVVLTMRNTSDKPLSANIAVTSQIVRYTGVALKKLPKRREKKDLQPKKGKGFVIGAFVYIPQNFTVMQLKSSIYRISTLVFQGW